MFRVSKLYCIKATHFLRVTFSKAADNEKFLHLEQSSFLRKCVPRFENKSRSSLKCNDLLPDVWTVKSGHCGGGLGAIAIIDVVI